jgi:acetyl-CoA/propionyl-CoA carboxylase biotin carboxyl carrier protein
VRVARAAGYQNLGTAEFLVTPLGPSFLEMNARLQVEHPVTELVWGVDLVCAQLRLAAGERLRPVLGRASPRGHALEVRVNAEDPAHDFQPLPGKITLWQPPAGPGVRVDAGVRAGDEVSDQYDSLLAKLCVWAEDRPRALARLRRALDEFVVEGVPTTLSFARGLLELPAFQRGGVPTSVAARVRLPEPAAATVLAASPVEQSGLRRYTVEVDGEVLHVSVRPEPKEPVLAPRGPVRAAPFNVRGAPPAASAPGEVRAPIAGTVLKLAAAEGAVVSRGDLLCVIEAMKMENEVRSPWAGTLSGWRVAPGSRVEGGAALCSVAQT